MKQIGISIQQYVTDYDGRQLIAIKNSTSAYIWPMIEPYLKNEQVLFCPSSRPFTDPWAPGNGWRASHYGVPVAWTPSTTYYAAAYAVSTTPSNFTIPLFDYYDEPSRICMFTDIQSNDLSSYQKYGWGGQVFYSHNGSGIFTLRSTTRHLEGANYAYADGHVKWLPADLIPPIFTQQNVGGTAQGITTANAADYPVIFAMKR